MDQSVHRPTTRQGSRRPAHPPRTHHRHRHRVLALPPRPAAAHYQERSLTPTEDRAAGIAAPPPPYGLRLHDDARAPHQATSTPTTTDARWSHFKPSRRGQRKPSRRAPAYRGDEARPDDRWRRADDGRAGTPLPGEPGASEPQEGDDHGCGVDPARLA